MKIYFNNDNGNLKLVSSLKKLSEVAKIKFECNINNLNSQLYCSEKFSWNHKTKNLVIYDVNPTSEFYESINCNFDINKDYAYDNLDNMSLYDKIINKYKVPDINSGFVFDKAKFYLLVRNILKKKNTLLTGPTGTGKTDIVVRICKILNIPCRVYDMGAMMDPLTDLLGQHKLKNGNSVFEYSRFIEDIQKPGVILLDEISRAPFGSNNILFPVLDHRRTLPVDIAGEDDNREIKVHDDCVFIATANIGNDYSGTYDLDSALLNRFIVMQVDYLDSNSEVELLTTKYNIDKKYASKIVAFANNVRSRYLVGKLSKPISTRETLSCAELVSDGFSVIDSIKFSMLEKYNKYGDNPEYEEVDELLLAF